ncbi:MAG: hypothetical protein MZV70_28570 [Desulfobacterales bacterium]|nr:hypothetical protein [Desulfobacterales bacterium]
MPRPSPRQQEKGGGAPHRRGPPPSCRAETGEPGDLPYRRESYVGLLDAATPHAEGPIIDIGTGKEIGRHRGIHRYTLGQRERLIATGRPVTSSG